MRVNCTGLGTLFLTMDLSETAGLGSARPVRVLWRRQLVLLGETNHSRVEEIHL